MVCVTTLLKLLHCCTTARPLLTRHCCCAAVATQALLGWCPRGKYTTTANLMARYAHPTSLGLVNTTVDPRSFSPGFALAVYHAFCFPGCILPHHTTLACVLLACTEQHSRALAALAIPTSTLSIVHPLCVSLSCPLPSPKVALKKLNPNCQCKPPCERTCVALNVTDKQDFPLYVAPLFLVATAPLCLLSSVCSPLFAVCVPRCSTHCCSVHPPPSV